MPDIKAEQTLDEQRASDYQEAIQNNRACFISPAGYSTTFIVLFRDPEGFSQWNQRNVESPVASRYVLGDLFNQDRIALMNLERDGVAEGSTSILTNILFPDYGE